MARPEQLQNQIYGAYGQGVTGFNYDQVGRSLEKDRQYKREELKNFYDIQADLDAAQVSSLKGTLDEMYKGIDTNELRVGSEEFQRQISKLKSQAVGLQETKQLAEDALKAVNENPDSMVYMTTDANGQPIAGGYNEIMKQFTDVTNRSYQDPQAYNSTINSMLGNFRPKVSEDTVFDNTKSVVDAQVEKQLKEQGLTEAEVTSKMIAYRKGQLDITKDIDVGAIVRNTKAALGDQLTMLYAQERGMGGIAEDMNADSFQDQYIKSLTPNKVSETETLNIPAPPKPTKDAVSQGDVEKAKNVKPDVYKAQQENDPIFINKYLRGMGYEARKGGNGLWEIVEYGKAKDEGARVIDSMNPNQAEEIYNAISEYGDMNREAIDQYEFNPQQVGDETPVERERRVAAEKQEKNIDIVLASLGEPDKKTLDSGRDAKDRRPNLDIQKSFLNSLEGVSFEDPEETSGFIRYITVDGTRYDMDDDNSATEANKAIKAQIRKNAKLSVPKEYSGSSKPKKFN